MPPSDIGTGQHLSLRDSVVGSLVADFDWSNTCLGPIESWAGSLRTIVDLIVHSPIPMVLMWGPEHRMIYNDGYALIAGGKHPQALGGTVPGIWPEIWDWNRRILEKGFRGEVQTHTGHLFMLERNGPAEEVWCDLFYSPVPDESGRVAGVLCTVIETTDRVKAMQATERSEARLRRTQEAGQVGGFELDLATERIEGSDMFFALWGLPPMRSAPSSQFRDLVHADDRWMVADTLRSVDEAPQLFAEYRIRRADNGEERWIARRASFESDADGRPARLVGTLHDITDLKRAEIALRRLNGDLEERVSQRTRERDRIWTVSQDLLCVADRTGAILSINPAWTRTLGWEEEEIVGHRTQWMEHPDDQNRTAAELMRLAQGETTLRFENRFRCKDGGHRWLSWTAVPAEGYLYCVARDVTAERERDAELEHARDLLRQSQKMEAIGQLTGGIAHDFNNLLQAVSGCLQMIGRRAGGQPGIPQLLDAGRQAVDRGARLVQQLMAFARKQSLRPEPFDLRNRLLGMNGLLERALRADIHVSMELAPGLWGAEADPVQFELAVLNLAVNARDAMPGGGRLIVSAANVTLKERTPDGLSGDYVRIRVSDTGTGMPPDIAARVFEPFFTTKEVGKGTGLGLSQVYGFARQSGGTASVESRPGEGTVVTLLLPRAQQVAIEPGIVAERTASPGHGVRILLVEDDLVVASVVSAALTDMGYAVAHAATGREALDRLRNGEAADLLCTDVVMPGPVNGVELAREAQKLRSGLPVVLTTGYAEGVGGMDGFRVLAKPYRIEDLAAAIEAELGTLEDGGPYRIQA
ncbi:PAS domain S-box protein [Azospirillum sp. TSA2s]|uniref:PAS domain S-box protein n=1 Tax=Azospirillum sp. TSA2s TaxID=709810 RepID=UPI0010AB040F|nr:PAS domain S-box protein [Azospirillum sp. TSA2s]QCG95510.1 PAS domain S-box protein [Azospirillum sp. TSA2s]